MKPLRKLTLSRKSSKQSMRSDREQTPPVPGSPAVTGLAGKSRPPESSSAGAAHASPRASESRDGSLRGKTPPSAYNGAAAEEEETPRKRKGSVV